MILKYYQKIDDALSYLFSSVCSEKSLLKGYFKKKNITFVDIGTNEGGYTDFIKKTLDVKKLYCFEPIDFLYEKLKYKHNNPNSKIYNLALSDATKNKKFYQYEITSQSSFYEQDDTFKSLKTLKKSFIIKTTTFDKMFNKNKKIDLCKIDTQGEDLNILKGMKKNLSKKNIKLLKIELLFSKIHKNTNSNFFTIMNFLKKYNYNLITFTKIKYKNNKLLFVDAFFE